MDSIAPSKPPGPGPAVPSDAGERLSSRWPFLDLVRFGAALLVLFGHVRYLYFEGIAQVQQPSVVTKAFYLVTGLQHEGVILFFIVSGFLVGGSIWQQMRERRFDAWRYLVNRFVRIYLVFVPALLLACVLFLAGEALLPAPRMHPGLLEGWGSFNLLCHAACLQGMFCAAGQNPPLWSLGYEWFLYLAAPLVFALLYAPLALVWRLVGLAILLASLLTLLPAHVETAWFAMWAAGALAWYGLSRGGTPRWLGLGALAAVACAFVAARAKVLPVPVTDAAIALGLALAVASPAVVSWCPAPQLFRRLADFSYSLYLTHLPVSLFCAELIARSGLVSRVGQPGPTTYVCFVLTAAVALGVAALFARATEARTERVRKAILGPR